MMTSSDKNISPLLFGYTSISLLTVICSYLIEDGVAGSGIVGQSMIGTATILQFAVISACMLVAWWRTKQSISENEVQLLLITGVIALILLIPVDSYTSNDVSRYLFDGKLAISGFDPYRVNHNAPELAELKAQWQPPEEHAKYVTLYPPIALALFSISAAFGHEYATLIWKLFATIASITTLVLGTHLLRKTQQQKHFPLLALSPLLILETGVGAHLDSFTALSVCLILWAWLRENPLLTGIFIALGAMIKILPLALLLPVVLSYRRFPQTVILIAAVFFTLALGYGLTFSLGFEPIGSIGVFFQKWRFGSPLFTALESLLTPVWLSVTVLSVLVVGTLTVLIRHIKFRKNHSLNIVEHHTFFIKQMQIILALPLLVSPVIFPWYLMIMVPLVVLAPQAWLLAWIILLPLTYEVLNQFIGDDSWQPAQWPLWVIGIALIGFIGWQGLRKFSERVNCRNLL